MKRDFLFFYLTSYNFLFLDYVWYKQYNECMLNSSYGS